MHLTCMRKNGENELQAILISDWLIFTKLLLVFIFKGFIRIIVANSTRQVNASSGDIKNHLLIEATGIPNYYVRSSTIIQIWIGVE